jgi:arginase family enzyme
MNASIAFDRLDRDSWREWDAFPLPPWCTAGPGLFGAPSAALRGETGERADVGVCSVSFDGTASTHVGARDGPASIRKASLAFSSQARSREMLDFTNMRTGRRAASGARTLLDFGDLHVFPSDPARQLKATAAEIFELAHRAGQLVILGGEHTISYPCFAAVGRATAGPLGYVQIDHHFDYGDTSVLHGRIYHGSNARRIAELPGMAPDRIGFVGQGDITGTAQLAGLIASGCVLRHRRDIHRLGFESALRQTLDAVCGRAPGGIYVSLDIDVCDGAAAPGTGHVTIGGISAEEFVATAAVLQDYPVRALDLVEVNPSRDPVGRTSSVAARLLYEYLLLDWGAAAA